MSTHQNLSAEYVKAEKPLYEGKASILWDVKEHPDLLIIERKNDITALDGQVKDSFANKGTYTNLISNRCFLELEKNGINTHYIEQLSDNETLIKKVEPLMLEVIVRNVATGSLCRKLPIEDGLVLKEPIVEFDYKSDEYGDPLINDDQAMALGIVKEREALDDIRQMARKINKILKAYFLEAGIQLYDFKIELGIDWDGNLTLMDEISPDTCRLRDVTTGEKLDKDIFRQTGDTDNTSVAYREVLDRLTKLGA